jgi:glutamate-1-semialdehyde aminotransferase
MSMTLNWPVFAFPNSEAEYEKTYDSVHSALKKDRSSIAAVVLEPVNWQTGATLSSAFIS